MGDVFKPNVSKDRQAEALLREQERKEKMREAEAQSDIEEKKIAGQSTLGGRGSLRTKKTGVKATKMGG